MNLNGWDFVEAARWLQQTYVQGTMTPRLALLNKPKPTNSISSEPMRKGPDSEIYNWLLQRAPLMEDGRSYLQGRGISEETMSSFRIGQVSDSEGLTREAIGTWRYDRIRASGLLTERSTPGNARGIFPSGYLLFPFFRGNQCRYIQARIVGDGNARPRWKCLLGIPPELYNIDVLFSSSAGDVLLCEGVTDVLSAAELKRQAIALLGAAAELPHECVPLLRRRTVYLLPDNDRAGRQMGKRLREFLAQQGISHVVQRLSPGCKDLNEHLMRINKLGHHDFS